MKQNKYDDEYFFTEYKKMERSVKGLEAAGEWHMFEPLLPPLQDKTVLDLGCGFGWHCRYAREQQASSVIGVDLSANMLQQARELTDDAGITYVELPMEDIAFADEQFDVVISQMTITDERKKEVDFTEPYFESLNYLVVREDSQIKSLKDIKGKTVAVLQASTCW